MGELLPAEQAGRVQDSLLDYLSTTFALADDDARSALTDFLQDARTGIFKGPYVRLRLPYRAADDGWRSSLEWYSGPTPYGHQAAAFARLSSLGGDSSRPRPQPTVVTTGTGSGKTEAFLYPILDHVLRAKRAGRTGTKALILYPMNALANDQAQRLATLISSQSALAGVTAALYTGQQGPERSKVSADGLITSRAVIRSGAPDILLTNYKMLDQMLLRHDDADLWRQSAHSLQYLVLDEFHTYDGAQGTDVAMLLRRLGLSLKSYWADDDPEITDEDRARPLGRVTPVATSATLGDQGDPEAMRRFAETIFGEPFPAEAVITETRLDVDDWAADSATRVAAHGLVPDSGSPTLERLRHHVARTRPGSEPARTLLVDLYRRADGDGSLAPDLTGASAAELLELVQAHPWFRSLILGAKTAVSLADLAQELVAATGSSSVVPEDAEAVTLGLLDVLSQVRAQSGRAAVGVDLHLWVRELTRLERVASTTPAFRWPEDLGTGEPDATVGAEPAGTFPAVYCRHCGRSGWGVVLAPTGHDLDSNDAAIRLRHLQQDSRFRPLISAPGEADRAASGTDIAGLGWLDAAGRQLLNQPGDREAELRAGTLVPVLTHVGQDAGDLSVADACPACGRTDGIRFLGSAVATLLSVTLSTLFGAEGLDRREKKALVFTDSVQDAAHRAGFVQSRSHSLTLRSVFRAAVDDEPLSLDTLVDTVLAQAITPMQRYRVLPPDLADRDTFVPFWQATRVPAGVRTRVKRRLLLDACLEFGLQSGVGRTLERTGTLAAHVEAPAPILAAAAQQAIDEAGGQRPLAGFTPPNNDTRVAWVRGVLERMRERGAIGHEWFDRYQREDGRRYSIWGGRPRSQGMPAFPRGRAAPGYPRIGGARSARDSDLDSVVGAQSWYVLWTVRCLQVAPVEAGALMRLLLARLAREDVLTVLNSDSGAQVFSIPQAHVLVSSVALADLKAGSHRLTCPVCRAVVPGSRTVVDQLDGAPCLVARCSGRLTRIGVPDNFYRRLYESSDVQRVVAREHTSLLDDKTRIGYENGFRNSQDDPQAPNVLVATPTLEMGIDIGDLSAVLLASLPRSVASYLQRVGRAGRLTGNALNLAFVAGRGDQLPRLGEPLSIINGEVRPPATYLDATEILRRQYLALIADQTARRLDVTHPRRATDALGSLEPTSYLGRLIAAAEHGRDDQLPQFVASLGALSKEAGRALTEWVSPLAGPGTSPLALRVHEAAQRWSDMLVTLDRQEAAIAASLPELQQRAELPAATDDDKTAYRSAAAGLRLTRKQLADLRGDYWISVVEEFGLLPNYTLLDDSVTLDVSLSWVDPDTGAFESEPHSYRRGSALALREFAPGATFYASGHKISIDAVDLGHDGEAVQTWAYCPACGFAANLDSEPPPATCPRCASTGIADVDQRFAVVELERVSAAMRREEAAIDDDRDERTRQPFTVAVAADVDRIGTQWFVDGYGFGVRHLPEVRLRWLNLGKGGSHGSTRLVAGEQYSAPLFRVCASCGQLDTSTHRNRAAEHRPWCPRRRAADEQTRTVALSRTLHTEGLVVRLPPALFLGDAYALPTLQAALLLGLRERLGGTPDHLAIETISEPRDDGRPGSRPALLLHDIVPGGTGYLADQAEVENFWTVLQAAYRVVRDCGCQDEDRECCHRCLLPFTSTWSRPWTSRLTAERLLRSILTAGDASVDPADRAVWTVTGTAATAYDPETHIEQRFRQTVLSMLRSLGATVTEKPGAHGNRLVINSGGGRVWTLDPQEYVLGCRPDFVLRTDDTTVPPVAIFCDGWRFHASPAHNRVADDADKRRILRDGGFFVLAVSWRDLEERDAQTLTPPGWLDPTMVPALIHASGGALSATVETVLTEGPLGFLARWIQAPDVAAVQAVADWLPLLLRGRSTSVTLAPDAPLDAVDPAPPADGDGTTGWMWSLDTLSVRARVAGHGYTEVDLALVLDDRDDQLGEHHADAWRTWLRLSNLVNRRTRSVVVGTTSSSGRVPVVAPELVAPSERVPAGWEDVMAEAGAVERALLLALADSGVERPTLGEEVADGIALSIAWPSARLAVDYAFDHDERRDLERAGWRLVGPDPVSIARELAGSR